MLARGVMEELLVDVAFMAEETEALLVDVETLMVEGMEEPSLSELTGEMPFTEIAFMG